MNDKNVGLASVVKDVLSSPVGGWALAVGIVAYMGWVTMQDRQAIYADMRNLRESAMPLIRENNALLKEMIRQLKEDKYGN